MKVKSVSYAGKADVFNMEVEDTHNFVIQGGVISHNCADMWRYVLMARPIQPRAKAERDPYEDSPLKTILDIPKDMVTARTPIPRMEIIGGTDDGSV